MSRYIYAIKTLSVFYHYCYEWSNITQYRVDHFCKSGNAGNCNLMIHLHICKCTLKIHAKNKVTTMPLAFHMLKCFGMKKTNVVFFSFK